MAFKNEPTITNTNNALSLIDSFITANGWTTANPSTDPYEIDASKTINGQTYRFEIVASSGKIRVRAVDDFTTPTHNSDWTYCNIIDAAMADMNLFAGNGGNNIYVSIEVAQNYFQMFGFGQSLSVDEPYQQTDMHGAFVLGSISYVYNISQNEMWDSRFNLSITGDNYNIYRHKEDAGAASWEIPVAHIQFSDNFSDANADDRLPTSMYPGLWEGIGVSNVGLRPLLPLEISTTYGTNIWGYFPDIYLVSMRGESYGATRIVGGDEFFLTPIPNINRDDVALINSNLELGLAFKK